MKSCLVESSTVCYSYFNQILPIISVPRVYRLRIPEDPSPTTPYQLVSIDGTLQGPEISISGIHQTLEFVYDSLITEVIDKGRLHEIARTVFDQRWRLQPVKPLGSLSIGSLYQAHNVDDSFERAKCLLEVFNHEGLGCLMPSHRRLARSQFLKQVNANPNLVL